MVETEIGVLGSISELVSVRKRGWIVVRRFRKLGWHGLETVNLINRSLNRRLLVVFLNLAFVLFCDAIITGMNGRAICALE